MGTLRARQLNFGERGPGTVKQINDRAQKPVWTFRRTAIFDPVTFILNFSTGGCKSSFWNGSLSFNNVQSRSHMICFPNSPRFLLSIHYTRYSTYWDAVTKRILGTARATKTQSRAHLRRIALRSSETKFTLLINNESLHFPFFVRCKILGKKKCDN